MAHMYTSHKDIDQAISDLSSNVKNVIDQAMVEKNNRNYNSSDVLPEAISEQIRIRNSMRKTWQNSYSDEDKQHYITMRTEVHKHISEYRTDTRDVFVEALCLQDGSLWKMTQKLMKKKGEICMLLHNNCEIYDDE